MSFALRWWLFRFLMAPAWGYEAILAYCLGINVRKSMSVERVEDDTHHA